MPNTTCEGELSGTFLSFPPMASATKPVLSCLDVLNSRYVEAKSRGTEPLLLQLV